MTTITDSFSTRQNFSSASGAIFLNNCMFLCCTSSLLGGAFYISNTNSDLYLNSCSFYNCSTTSTLNSAGCGFVKVNNISFFRVCCYYCYTLDGGSSFRIEGSNYAKLDMFSYAFCSPSSFHCEQESFLIYCYTSITNGINSSNNYARQSSSAIAFYTTSYSTIYYSNIAHNSKSEEYGPIRTSVCGAGFSYCNLINNTGLGLIDLSPESVNTRIDLLSCIILQNKFVKMFRGCTLFTPTMVNCFYQNPNQTIISSSGCLMKETNSYTLNLLSTGYCYVTPIYTHQRVLSKTNLLFLLSQIQFFI